VLEQQARLPDYLQSPMKLATLGFDLLGCLHTGRLFHSRPAPVRARQLAKWKSSEFAFHRDLMRYYESLVAFALYSRSPARTSDVASSTIPAQQLDTSHPPANSQPELQCEIAVIGSGPGGAITASLLAEAGRNVLLIEEGPSLSLESCNPFSLEEMLTKYRNGGQTVALGKNKIAFVEGRCVGGGSEINSGLYHRTPPEVLESWRTQYQVEALDEQALAPHFLACERDLSVSLSPNAHPAASLKLQQGAARLGWSSVEVPRWYRYAQSDDQRGARQSMSKALIPRFLKAGGRLLPSTRVWKISRSNGKWSIQARNSAGELRIQVESLFVCAGAVQSPALLRRSGITKNIGNSLQLHPTIKLAARFSDNVNSQDMGVPVHQVKEFAPRLSLGCSVSSPPYLALGMLDNPQSLVALPGAWPNMANYYAMITPEGRGTVRPVPMFRDALVRYQLTENDRRNLADGLRKLTELIFEAGAVHVSPALPNSQPLVTRDDLKKLPDVLPNGLANLMTIHLFSSCPMGEDQSKCAVDSFGRVHGFTNLFVSDASILCSAPGVNPQGTIMALARRNALHFLNQKK
jgi:choline dehydrogenase-like flavoprotein